jgi:hypothetical protein
VVRILRDLLDAINSILGYSYYYRDLEINKRSLRLLILLPGSFHEDTRYHLIHTSLDEPGVHRYEALSYTCGPLEKNHFIWIDAYKFPVTANLHHALQHLRQDVVRFLWVDAIYINQDGIPERNEQVQYMHAICSWIRQEVTAARNVVDSEDTRLKYRIPKEICKFTFQTQHRIVKEHLDKYAIKSTQPYIHSHRQLVIKQHTSNSP